MVISSSKELMSESGRAVAPKSGAYGSTIVFQAAAAFSMSSSPPFPDAAECRRQ
jgi:hypothetical protein